MCELNAKGYLRATTAKFKNFKRLPKKAKTSKAFLLKPSVANG